MKMVSEKVRIVSKNEVVIQSGERKGEVVFRLDVAGDGGTLTDVQAKVDVAVFNELVLFVEEYDVFFDYSMRAFNGKSYVSFSIVDVKKTGFKKNEKVA